MNNNAFYIPASVLGSDSFTYPAMCILRYATLFRQSRDVGIETSRVLLPSINQGYTSDTGSRQYHYASH